MNKIKNFGFSLVMIGGLASCDEKGHLTDVQIVQSNTETTKAKIVYVLEGNETDTLKKTYTFRLTPDSEKLPPEARKNVVDGYIVDMRPLSLDEEIPSTIREEGATKILKLFKLENEKMKGEIAKSDTQN